MFRFPGVLQRFPISQVRGFPIPEVRGFLTPQVRGFHQLDKIKRCCGMKWKKVESLHSGSSDFPKIIESYPFSNTTPIAEETTTRYAETLITRWLTLSVENLEMVLKECLKTKSLDQIIEQHQIGLGKLLPLCQASDIGPEIYNYVLDNVTDEMVKYDMRYFFQNRLLIDLVLDDRLEWETIVGILEFHKIRYNAIGTPSDFEKFMVSNIFPTMVWETPSKCQELLDLKLSNYIKSNIIKILETK